MTGLIQNTGRAFAQAGESIAVGTRALFSRARSAWQIVYARTRFNYRADVGDPMSSSIVAAIVGWIARNFPEAPVAIHRLTPEGNVPVAQATTGPGRMLQLLERPNRYYSGPTMWRAVIVDYMAGDAYIYKERAEPVSASDPGRVLRLWWIPAFMLEPKWDEHDPTSFLDWYEYTVDGTRYRLETDDVIHLRNGIDPRNVRKGLGQMGSLFRELYTDNEAAALTAALMRNLGVPGVIIAPANTNQGPMRQRPGEIKAKFDETFGGDGRGGTLVLTRPTEVKVLSWSPEQMNLRELRRIPEERASAVLGVPAGVAGLGAGLDRNTFTNYGEANVSAYTQGVIPLQRDIASELEVQLLDEFADLEDGYDVWFDWTQVKAMTAFFEALWKRYSEAARAGLVTRAEWKRALGLKPDPAGRDDVYVVANNIREIPVGKPDDMTPGRPPPAGGRPSPAVTAGNGNGHGPIAQDQLEPLEAVA
jgi:HK97 family phage portal protein